VPFSRREVLRCLGLSTGLELVLASVAPKPLEVTGAAATERLPLTRKSYPGWRFAAAP
jgi:hypothetical protein